MIPKMDTGFRKRSRCNNRLASPPFGLSCGLHIFRSRYNLQAGCWAGEEMSSQDRLDLVSARALDLNAVVPGGRDSSTPAPVIAASNVVPFLRVRREPAAIEPTPPLSADPSQRPAPDAQGPEGRLWIIAFFVLSLLVHGGLYAVLNREPEPMASIGLEAISVEI